MVGRTTVFFAGILGMMLQGSLPGQDLDVIGRTLREDGTPAAYVEVEVVVTDMRNRRPVGTLVTRSTALGDFYFDLADDFATIPRLGMDFRTASPEFRQTTFIHVANQDEFPVGIDLVLVPGIAVRGQVLSEDGTPVAGARVSGGDDRVNVTDEEGRFEVYGMPPGRRARLGVAAPGFSTFQEVLEVSNEGAMEGHVVTLRNATALEGVVRKPGGEPVTHGMVSLLLLKQNRRWQERIGSDGRFRFGAVPLVEDDEEVVQIVAGSEGFYPAEANLKMRDLTEPRPLEMTLRWGVKLRGTVTDDSGNILGGGVVAFGDGRQSRVIRSAVDERGRWELGPFAPSEEILLSALPPPPRRGTFIADVIFTEQGGTHRGEIEVWSFGPSSVFEVEKGVGDDIRMTRRDSGPGAVPGIMHYEGTIQGDFAAIEGTVTVESTGATGTFRMRPHNRAGRLRGDWELRETLDGGRQLAAPVQRRVSLAPLEGVQIMELSLDAQGIMEGSVVEEDGAPRRSGKVRIAEWNGTYVYQAEAAIGLDGRFLLEGLPQGVLTVELLDTDNSLLAPPQYLRAGLRGIVLHVGNPPDDPVTEWRPAR